MKKKIVIAVLILSIVVSAVSGVAFAAEEECPEIVVYLNGEKVELPRPARMINDITYVPLRAVAMALGATEVTWKNGVAEVSAPGLYITANTSDPYIVANGRYLYVRDGVKLFGGYLMVPVRTLAKAFGATVNWNGPEALCDIKTGHKPIRSGSEYYNEDDLYWMSHIIYSESGNQPLEGMIAVGTVVLNRVASKRYPDTIYDVIFDFNCGIQFEPALNGTVYYEPSEKSIIAAKLVLDGAREAEECMFFASIKDCWAAYNRPYVMTIGGHDFYA